LTKKDETPSSFKLTAATNKMDTRFRGYDKLMMTTNKMDTRFRGYDNNSKNKDNDK
jgi:hypothetical protein